MPGKKRTSTKGPIYRCIRGFVYLVDASVRERIILGGEHMPQEERGERTYHVIGDELRKRDLPPDVFADCIAANALELIDEEPQPEEVPDDTQE